MKPTTIKMTTTLQTAANGHAICDRDEWLQARAELLKKEKEFTRAQDALTQQIRDLPWVRIEKPYVFDGPEGKVSLSDLFGGNSQLVIQHFMFGPDWEEGCFGCSFLADHAAPAAMHLRHHDVTLVAVSRAPWEKIAPFKKRMGWEFPWYSSYESDFNFDFEVSIPSEKNGGDPEIEEDAGASFFYRDDSGAIYHTYSFEDRGAEILLGAYHYLDRTPNGRNEGTVGHLGYWVRHHDRYELDDPSACCSGNNS